MGVKYSRKEELRIGKKIGYFKRKINPFNQLKDLNVQHQYLHTLLIVMIIKSFILLIVKVIPEGRVPLLHGQHLLLLLLLLLLYNMLLCLLLRYPVLLLHLLIHHLKPTNITPMRCDFLEELMKITKYSYKKQHQNL